MNALASNLRASAAHPAEEEASADTAARFVILRKESDDGYSTRGPITWAMPFEKAREEIVKLKTQYPHLNFVLAAEIGEAVMTESVGILLTGGESETAQRYYAPGEAHPDSLQRMVESVSIGAI